MSTDQLVSAYLDAKDCVIGAGYANELDWQDDRDFANVCESDFLCQVGWVILAAGLRDSVVRGLFPAVSDAFLNWHGSEAICNNRHQVRSRALSVLNHKVKIDSVLHIAELVEQNGFSLFKFRIARGGVGFLSTLPYMGPATAYHLAKNLGLDCVKPDRHLLRVAAATGHTSPASLCKSISHVTGERLSVIDLVIWRFATIEPEYVRHFALGSGDGSLHPRREGRRLGRRYGHGVVEVVA